MSKIIIVKTERCVGCKTCELECALAHSDAADAAEAARSQNPPQKRIYVESVGGTPVPIHCHHCEDAPCVVVCPTGAMAREDSDAPVLLDPEKCTGCKFCMLVCPFGVISLPRDGSKALVKCDLCAERVREGKEPACVAGCPTAAIEFVELDEYLRQRRREESKRIAAEAGEKKRIEVKG